MIRIPTSQDPRRWQSDFFRSSIIGLIVVGLAAMDGCDQKNQSPPTDDKTAPDAPAQAAVETGPRSAAIAFARAVEAGNASALHQLATGNDVEFDSIQQFGTVHAAYQRFAAALVQKFGAGAKALAQKYDVDLVADYQGAQENIDDDIATLTPAPRGARAGLNIVGPKLLRKEAAGWKIDLSAGDEGQKSADVQRLLTSTAGALDATAKNILADKYQAADQAIAELESQIDAAQGQAREVSTPD